MRQFWKPNIDRKGRLLRGILGFVLLISAALSLRASLLLSLPLAAIGIFTLFEAMRGWCVARACGIKTRF